MRKHKVISIVLTILVVVIFIMAFLFSSDIALSIGYTVGLIIGIYLLIKLNRFIVWISGGRKYKKKHGVKPVDLNGNSEYKVSNAKCPICESNTILRTVGKGPDAGKQFHVCVKYPECKGRILARKSTL